MIPLRVQMVLMNHPGLPADAEARIDQLVNLSGGEITRDVAYCAVAAASLPPRLRKIVGDWLKAAASAEQQS